MTDLEQVVAEIRWNRDGLVPTIAQDVVSGKVLMLAWMNRESFTQTLTRGVAVYWSRSRGRLWEKGETSGQRQRVVDVRLDCDGDALLLRVEQTGVACHTGRRSCFYRQLRDGSWSDAEAVLIDPTRLYSG